MGHAGGVVPGTVHERKNAYKNKHESKQVILP